MGIKKPFFHPFTTTTMGSAASLNNAASMEGDQFDFNPDEELDINAMELEAENDLQQVIDQTELDQQLTWLKAIDSKIG